MIKKDHYCFLHIFYGYSIGGENTIWLFDCICNIISCLIIYKICNRFTTKKSKSLLTVIICMIFLSWFYLENPCSESLALPFILLSFDKFILFILEEDKFSKKESFITGACLGAVLLLRPNLISLWIVYDLCIFIKLIKDKKVKKLLNIILFTIIGLIAILIPFLLYLIVNNAFKDFIDIYLLFNIKYSGIKEHSIIQTIYYFIKNTKFTLVGVLLLNIILIYFTNKKKNQKENLLLITNFIYYLITFTLVIMPQRNYIHYAIIMIPTIIAPIIILLKNINIKESITVAITFVTVMYLGMYVFNYVSARNNLIYGYKEKMKIISKYIQSLTDENDNVLQLGLETNLYNFSDRYYKGKYIYQFPVVKYSEKIATEALEDIKNELPKLIVDLRIQIDLNDKNKFNEEITYILQNNYDEVSKSIYLRKERVDE